MDRLGTAALVTVAVFCLGACTAVAAGLAGSDGVSTSEPTTGEPVTPQTGSDNRASNESVPPGEQFTATEEGTDDIRYASPDGTVREAYVQSEFDVSAAVAAETARVQGQYRQRVFEARLNRTDDQAAVEETAESLTDRVVSTTQRPTRLLERYADGELSTDRFLGALLRMRVEAVQASELADSVLSVARRRANVSLSESTTDRLGAAQAQPLSLLSPVTESLEPAVAGTSTGDRLYVQASASGLVLADGGSEQTRQATLWNQRNASAPDQFVRLDGSSVANAFGRANRLYPASYSFDGGSQVGSASVYRLGGSYGSRASNPVTLYLDGGTTNVFHELQTLDAQRLPTTTTTATDGTLSLTLDSTVPSGPMRVLVTDNGAPVDGTTVRIGGQVAGTTDEDGTLWTTQPVGTGRVRVTTPGGQSVTATLP